MADQGTLCLPLRSFSLGFPTFRYQFHSCHAPSVCYYLTMLFQRGQQEAPCSTVKVSVPLGLFGGRGRMG